MDPRTRLSGEPAPRPEQLDLEPGSPTRNEKSNSKVPGARILVVDDEPDLVALLAYNLRNAGHQVFTASSGQDGLRRAQCVLPDLIILDVMLPDLDGFTVCEHLRRQPATALVPVLMLTAVAGEIPRYHALSCGATDFLRKPFEPRHLIERVRDALAACA